MKTMPSFSTAFIAREIIFSLSSSLSLSSCSTSFSASATVILRFLYFSPIDLPKISPRLIIPIWAPGMPGISIVGMVLAPVSITLISISRSARAPSRSILRNFCLVSSLAETPTSASKILSSAAIAAFSLTSLRILSRVLLMAMSSRSRIIDSTSRPT